MNMNMNMNMNTKSNPDARRPSAKGLMSVVCGVGLGASAWACDLPSKDIGVEDTATSGATEGGGDTETASSGGECQPGDMMDAPDGCNTCYCTEEGLWACTGIGCVDTDGGPDLPTPCQPGQSVPAGDGCNECVCQDDGETWACTLLGCETEGDTGEPPGGDPFDNNGLEVCGPDVPTDELFVNAATVEGHDLKVSLEYGGGCETHLLGACWDGMFAESEPVQVRVFIAHDNNGDLCDALVSEDRVFDLSPLAEAYVQGYQTDHGTIVIHLQGWGEPLEYTF